MYLIVDSVYSHVHLHVQVTLIIYEACVPANHYIYRKRVKQGTYNNNHSDVKLEPKFSEAKLFICIIYRNEPEEDLIQLIHSKIWLQTRH